MVHDPTFKCQWGHWKSSLKSTRETRTKRLRQSNLSYRSNYHSIITWGNRSWLRLPYFALVGFTAVTYIQHHSERFCHPPLACWVSEAQGLPNQMDGPIPFHCTEKWAVRNILRFGGPNMISLRSCTCCPCPLISMDSHHLLSTSTGSFVRDSLLDSKW